MSECTLHNKVETLEARVTELENLEKINRDVNIEYLLKEVHTLWSRVFTFEKQEAIEKIEKRIAELEKLIDKNGIHIHSDNGNSFDVIVNDTLAGLWVSNLKQDKYLGVYSTSYESAIGIGHYHYKKDEPHCLDACLAVYDHVGMLQLNTKDSTKQYDGNSLPGNTYNPPEIKYS